MFEMVTFHVRVDSWKVCLFSGKDFMYCNSQIDLELWDTKMKNTVARLTFSIVFGFGVSHVTQTTSKFIWY